VIMELTSWEERWIPAYTHGPIRVLVRNRRRLTKPQLVPVVIQLSNWKPPRRLQKRKSDGTA
jgi:hypothetical protein